MLSTGARRRLRLLITLSIAVAAVMTGAGSATVAAAGNSTISGTAFKDLNRDGVRQLDEPALSDQQLYLFDGSGTYVGQALTDVAGSYVFSGLADGDYRVQYASPSWWPLRNDWVPSTTGSIFPKITVHLTGSATANFGWRQIVRSTDPGAPISTYVGSNGLRVESFDDAVAAKEIFDAAMRGTVGPEANLVTIRFDLGPTASTVAGWQGSSGSFSGYSAICYDNYVSWLDGDTGVGHEYGHAWSLYYDTIVQQDGTLSSYLKARGLYGDPRVNSTYAWSAREMIAEDYRQLLGSPTAQTATQMNTEIPPAASVAGLKDFLLTTFTTPPPASAPPPPPAPSPTLTVTPPTISPTPVSKSGTVTTSVSVAASVTIIIKASNGTTVRTLLSGASEPVGTVSASWNRTDSNGRRVKSGTYTAFVQATASGNTVTSGSPFAVS